MDFAVADRRQGDERHVEGVEERPPLDEVEPERPQQDGEHQHGGDGKKSSRGGSRCAIEIAEHECMVFQKGATGRSLSLLARSGDHDRDGRRGITAIERHPDGRAPYDIALAGSRFQLTIDLQSHPSIAGKSPLPPWASVRSAGRSRNFIAAPVLRMSLRRMNATL